MGGRLGAVRIGTRASALARAQTEAVIQALRATSPRLRIEPRLITTSGDRTQATNAPGEGWGSGVFVKELEAALLAEQIDLAVHSLKDLTPEPSGPLALVAIPARHDPWDVLVTPDGRGLADLPAGARVGTSSARRAAFLRHARPDLRFPPIRGNVDTRCRKLLAGEVDALVLASAGLTRLGLAVARVPLDPALLLPAPGQGALALQARATDHAIRRLAQPLHHPPTAAAIAAERRLMAELEGGCRLPVAALATPSPNGTLELSAAVAAADGSRVLRASERGTIQAPIALAAIVAGQLRAAGASHLLAIRAEALLA